MIVNSSINNEYIKVTSENIDNFIANLNDYEKLTVKGTYNCCCEPAYVEEINVFTGNSWGADLTNAVDSSQIIDELLIENIVTGVKQNSLINPIDLGYVLSNCTSDCTLQYYEGAFAPNFKSQIDAYFLTLGITTDVQVQIVINTVVISGIPANFRVYNLNFVSSANPVYFMYTDGTITSDKIFLGADGLYIKPIFFNQTELADGIYKVEVKLHKTNSFIVESNCAFIDIKFKCLVASVLQNIIKEADKGNTERLSTTITLLHYALFNGSNCGCNCDELCDAFKALNLLLSDINPQIQNNCGC